MHYLVTGHTGFKGAWLTMMLTQAGHRVSGMALDPIGGALYEVASVGELVELDLRGDIRDADAVRSALSSTQPDVVIHMAAQPLVRESYTSPRWTMETNVMGTLNVLDAVSRTPSVRAQVIVTTDKVYRNVNQVAGYVESDALGGHDPYSSSKAMADLLTQSWTASFPGCPTAIARAGNVIGGGDVSNDRLLPDLLRAFAENRTAQIRYPDAVRPWQHVLDCLNGYAMLADAVLAGSGSGSWNFGPGPDSFVTVGAVADLAAGMWGADAGWMPTPGDHPHEAELLALDATKARTQLGWVDRLSFTESLQWTVDWTARVDRGEDPRTLCNEQLSAFAARGAS
jgi:CDP-glucose 4,6-dehydratase